MKILLKERMLKNVVKDNFLKRQIIYKRCLFINGVWHHVNIELTLNGTPNKQNLDISTLLFIMSPYADIIAFKSRMVSDAIYD
ncbi:hypothetical protein KHA80_17870 [Anaerobacillus sp. HL2]|nr:hypothetical protein KHA80_17870 [Anaerobacillus sp. HL2]